MVDISYGVFRITYKENVGPFGAYEIRCPFHKYSYATGCKKTKQVAEPGNPGDFDDCILWLCTWASRWQHHDRQVKHRKDDKCSLADVPSRAELNELKPLVKPAKADVKTDEELDAAAAAAATAAA